jgi:hypothetical protein
MGMDNQIDPGFGDTPVYHLHGLGVNLILSFSPLMKTNWFYPFIMAGLGVYPWRITRSFLISEAVPVGNGSDEVYSGYCAGALVGAGITFTLLSDVSLRVTAQYLFADSRDKQKYGLCHSNQGFMIIRAGLVQYFNLITE